MHCLIFANGAMHYPDQDRTWLDWAELVIAADGGARHALAYERPPDVLIGDFDSLSTETRTVLEQAGAQILQHPADKDTTDLELALAEAVARGSTDIVVLGGVGSRWDQSVTNLLLGAQSAYAGVRFRVVDGPQQAELLRGGGSLTFTGQPGDLLSLIPVGGDAVGIETQSLAYPLQGEDLAFGASRGVSNALTNSQATLSIDGGFLLCVLIRIHDPAWPE